MTQPAKWLAADAGCSSPSAVRTGRLLLPDPVLIVVVGAAVSRVLRVITLCLHTVSAVLTPKTVLTGSAARLTCLRGLQLQTDMSCRMGERVAHSVWLCSILIAFAGVAHPQPALQLLLPPHLLLQLVHLLEAAQRQQSVRGSPLLTTRHAEAGPTAGCGTDLCHVTAGLLERPAAARALSGCRGILVCQV